MAIPINTLESAALRSGRWPQKPAFSVAKATSQQTAFLSHSSSDKKLAEGLQVILNENGWHVYLYWQDSEMPNPPTRENAEIIQDRIKSTDWFLFLATPNSMTSRWCPWEIGYADGVKPYDNIMIIPTVDYNGKWHGNEYLQFYRRISNSTTGGFISIKPNKGTGTRIDALIPSNVFW